MNLRFLLWLGVIGIAPMSWASDSTAVITGKIIDGVTEKPIPDAKIFYQDMPYGNYVGIFNCDNGTIQVEVDNSYDYMVRASAEGYNSESAQLEISKAGDKVEHVFKLMPSAGGHLIRLETLHFDQGSDEINPEAYEEIDNVIYQMLMDNPNMVIQLEGHTDRNMTRNVNANYKLSERRVAQVKKYLVDKGIESKRVQTKAFGGTQPLTKENTPEARALNRRVEVRIVSNIE